MGGDHRGQSVSSGFCSVVGGSRPPSEQEWIFLHSYAVYACRETVVAPSCEIDTKRLTDLSDDFVEIRKHYTLTDEQQRTLDNDLTECLGGQLPPPKMTVDPEICAGARHVETELSRMLNYLSQWSKPVGR